MFILMALQKNRGQKAFFRILMKTMRFSSGKIRDDAVFASTFLFSLFKVRIIDFIHLGKWHFIENTDNFRAAPTVQMFVSID